MHLPHAYQHGQFAAAADTGADASTASVGCKRIGSQPQSRGYSEGVTVVCRAGRGVSVS